ncbi:class F sortase [Streptomyces sp. NBC_01198]|uniref:class F sortase n=1 Tax=Streptomyces sp. NBC_01198 TaxID=2903769 RepID=UPI002E166BDF|nr:class F sortase [Streptomyces sp. NBC_01198]
MQPPSARRPATALLAVPLALLLAGSLAGCGSGDPEAASPAVDLPSVSSAPASAPASGPATTGKAVTALPASVPTRVTIPSAGVDAGPLVRLGLNADGTIQVPTVAQADRIGWYTKGVTPGQIGPAVLVGHFDTVDGPAVMRNVTKIKQGDRITVTRADGSRAVFAVTSLQQVSKTAFPTQRVYGDTDRPELRLITCGGPITGGHHPDNIIVYADLVG